MCTVLFIQDEWGSTPLIRACIQGDLTTATLLIEKGANIEYQNKVRVRCVFMSMVDVFSL